MTGRNDVEGEVFRGVRLDAGWTKIDNQLVIGTDDMAMLKLQMNFAGIKICGKGWNEES